MKRRALGFSALVFSCCVLVACSGVTVKKGETSNDRQRKPHTHGVLTGKDREFVIFRVEGDPVQSGEEVKKGGEAEKRETE